MQHNATIFESLFNRNFADPGNAEFLEGITTAHPYFSPAQFYLLQQSSPGTGSYAQQVTRTNILFNNPHWLHFQLTQTGQAVEEQPAITPAVTAAEQEPENSDALINDTDAAEATDQEIEPMHIELKMPEQSTKLSEAMLFEPMHMVDYFASQGIKLPEDVQSADKLGKQLKSFTEWLKTMKKIHVEAETGSTVQTDQQVNVLAEHSNADAGVLTESMAEVFAKQGKRAKASEVYQKLSLLNPAKSTYFAAKIENLKEI